VSGIIHSNSKKGHQTYREKHWSHCWCPLCDPCNY